MPASGSGGPDRDMGAAVLVGVGLAVVVVLTLLTDHYLGALRVLPYWFHLAVAGLIGITFSTAPMLFSFSGLDAGYYWANGAAVMLVIGLHKPEPGVLTPAARA